ncbi:MAG: hypothetical protein ABL925_19470 [Methylococcales bacterium]
MPDLQGSDDSSDLSNQSELMHKWLDNQRHELQLENSKLSLRDKELEHNRALSEKSIDAQLQDRSEERRYSQSIIKQVFIFLGITILMLLLFGGYVVYKDKEAFLSEIIGLVIELGKYLSGAVVGFFIAKSRYNSGSAKNGDNE